MLLLKTVKRQKLLYRAVREEQRLLAKNLKVEFKTDIPVFNRVLLSFLFLKKRYIYTTLIFLTANMFQKPNSLTHRSAVLFFFLENMLFSHANLEQNTPFKIPFIHKWKTKLATLLGDFFLAKGLSMAVKNKDYAILTIISQIVRSISESALLREMMRDTKHYCISNYLKLIERQNAYLCSQSCEIGGLSVSATKINIEKLRHLGQVLGKAFSLQADLRRIKPQFYTRPNYLISLPCLYAFKQLPATRQLFENLLQKNSLQRHEQHLIFKYLKQSKAVAYTQKYIQEYFKEAKTILNSFETSLAQKTLSHYLNQP